MKTSSVTLLMLALGVAVVSAAGDGYDSASESEEDRRPSRSSHHRSNHSGRSSQRQKPTSTLDKCIEGACKVGKAAGHVVTTVTKDAYNTVRDDPQLVFQAASALNRNRDTVKDAYNLAAKAVAKKSPPRSDGRSSGSSRPSGHTSGHSSRPSGHSSGHSSRPSGSRRVRRGFVEIVDRDLSGNAIDELD
ncbi:hypothetical protein C8J56DRAFT_1162650 [Mycena floridula]|nr:hypothetical protein C8J56DRAFT_1162650 [Mycena floridula]